jgi:hypothetical protein
LLQQANDIIGEVKVGADEKVRAAEEKVGCLKQRAIKDPRIGRKDKAKTEFKK